MVLTGPGLLLDREQAKEVTVGSWGDILGTLTKGREKARSQGGAHRGQMQYPHVDDTDGEHAVFW